MATVCILSTGVVLLTLLGVSLLIKCVLCGEWCKVTRFCSARKQKRNIFNNGCGQSCLLLFETVYTGSILFLAVKRKGLVSCFRHVWSGFIPVVTIHSFC